MIFVYRLMWLLLVLPVGVLLLVRTLRGKEDFNRIHERFGWSSQQRPAGKLVWIHGSSVGETLSIQPLVQQLLQQDEQLHILVTSGTRTSAALMVERLPSKCIHQYVPLDFYPFVRLFMRRWKPNVSVLVESELWPEMMWQSRRLMIVNGRISNKSFIVYRKIAFFLRAVLARVRVVQAQSAADGTRYYALGAPKVEFTGNLKYDIPVQEVDTQLIQPLMHQLAGRQLVVLASTHAPEESLLLSSIQKLLQTHPHVLVLCVPRHPHRGDELRALFSTAGLNVQQRSKGGAPTPTTQVYIADTVGEMGLWFTLCARLGGVVFMGKTFKPNGGGQNPLEPLVCGAHVIVGPDMSNFKEMMRTLLARQLVQQVRDISDWLPAVTEALQQPVAPNTATARLADVQGATAHAAAAVQQYLAEVV